MRTPLMMLSACLISYVYVYIVLPSLPSFLPSSPPLPSSFSQILTRIVHYVLSATDITISDELLVSGNKCVTELCHCIQNHAAPSATMVAGYVVKQLQIVHRASHELALSIVELITQVCMCLCG